MRRIFHVLAAAAVATVFFACLEPRLDRQQHSGKIAKLKLIELTPPAWARHHADMPQFTKEQQRTLLAWLTEGKVELNPEQQKKDFEYIHSVDQILETGEGDDKARVRLDVVLQPGDTVTPTQLEVFWGNVAPKIIDSLTPDSRFSACEGKILTAFETNRYYILDGHHRYVACMFLRRYAGRAEDFKKRMGKFEFYEDRKIYELLANDPQAKSRVFPDLKVDVIDGNPQGIARALFELAKLGHGRFARADDFPVGSEHFVYLRNTMLLDNSLMQWLLFAGIVLASFVFSRILVYILRLRLRHRPDDASKRISVTELIVQTLRKYIYSVVFLTFIKLGLPVLTVPQSVVTAVGSGLNVAVIWLITVFSSRLFNNFMLGWQERLRERENEAEIAHLFPLLIRVGKLLIYMLGVLFILNRVGYNLYSAIAGLSVGGFALAMAGREAAGHIFAGISLYIDKVIKEGDYLLLPEPISTWGRVERVGIRSTHIRTKYNSMLIVPNSILANTQVNNVSAGGRKRMFRGSILLSHTTPAAALNAAIEKFKTIIEATPHTQEADVHFMRFDAFGFYVRIQYFVEPFFNYHDTVHAINCAILAYLETQGIRPAVNLQEIVDKGPT